MKIWDLFKSATKASTSSTDLKATRTAFVEDRDRLAAELAKGQSDRAVVLREHGPDALSVHQEKLRKLADDIDARVLAIEEIDTKLAEAEKLEAEADFEKNAKAAATAMRMLDHEVRRNFLAKVDDLAEIIKRGADLTSQIKAFNRTAGELGRSDRRIIDESMAALNAAAPRPMPIEHPLLSPSLARELEAVQQFAAIVERTSERKAAA